MKQKIMKFIKKVLVAVLYPMSLVLIAVFFSDNREYTFFATAVLFIALCYNAIKSFVTEKTERKHYTVLSIWLFFAIIATNELYRYQRLVALFPVIEELPKDILWIFGVGILLICLMGVAVYKFYCWYKETEVIYIDDNEQTISESRSGADSKVLNEVQYEGKNKNKKSRNDDSEKENHRKAMTPKYVLKTSFILVIFLATVVAVSYMVIVNIDVLSQIDGEKSLSTLGDIFLIFTVMLSAVCCIVQFLLNYIIGIYKTIRNLIYNGTNSKVDSTSVLDCVSLFITVMLFIYFKDITTDELVNKFADAKEIATILAGAFMLIVAVIAYQLIRWILRSCMGEDGQIRNVAIRIGGQLTNTIEDIVNKILTRVQKVPDLIDLMFDVLKQAIEELRNLFFED